MDTELNAPIRETFSLPIWGHEAIERNGRPTVFGTVTLVCAGECSFLVTAAHVLDRLFKANSPPHLPVGNGLRPLKRAFYATKVIDGQTRAKDRVDLAFYPLSDSERKEIEAIGGCFIQLPAAAAVSDEGPRVVVRFSGWPSSRSTPNFRDKIALAKDATYEGLEGDLKFYELIEVDKTINIAIPFEREKSLYKGVEQVIAPDPTGISGGPVWGVALAKLKSNESASRQLIGIGIEHLEPKKALLAVRLHMLLGILRATVPATANYISQQAGFVCPEMLSFKFECE
jgi:hypothetical protein